MPFEPVTNFRTRCFGPTKQPSCSGITSNQSAIAAVNAFVGPSGNQQAIIVSIPAAAPGFTAWAPLKRNQGDKLLEPEFSSTTAPSLVLGADTYYINALPAGKYKVDLAFTLALSDTITGTLGNLEFEVALVRNIVLSNPPLAIDAPTTVITNVNAQRPIILSSAAPELAEIEQCFTSGCFEVPIGGYVEVGLATRYSFSGTSTDAQMSISNLNLTFQKLD